ncbi:hypothetical protein SAMN05519103_01943 [Rhizobiales bacterium GAS113]|nr:hypothetical protein SAMN05519103_01943 [Rhizobiales bacterium GAS113]
MGHRFGNAGDGVREAHRPDELTRAQSGELISEAEAEREGGIDHRVVSRWRNGLADERTYRERMYGRAYAAGMGLDRKTAKTWVRSAKAGRALPNGDCTLIHGDIADVEARWKLGQLLAKVEKDKGGRPATNSSRAEKSFFGAFLKEIGLDKSPRQLAKPADIA